MSKIAVVYLCRGADEYWDEHSLKFINSYIKYNAGIDHQLYVVLKGFSGDFDLQKAKNLFLNLNTIFIEVDDIGFDIGSYKLAISFLREDYVCFINSKTFINGKKWLHKLYLNLTLNNIGLVGSSGSYESLAIKYKGFKKFPNPHIRTTGFMIKKSLICYIFKDLIIEDKIDAYRFESGKFSLTNQVLNKGLDVLVVGKNGRGYSIKNWIYSNTFRQGNQDNLLLSDNQTENYKKMKWGEKQIFHKLTWGNNEIY